MKKQEEINNKKITIAIDGWSSCGKSTLAKALASALNYTYVDSGAMYRGVAYFAQTNNLISAKEVDEERLAALLPSVHLSLCTNSEGDNELYLNHVNIEKEIRSPEISSIVSPIAKIKAVRQFLVAQQQRMGKGGGIVMDGRDIGSVVFPSAELKLFLTASIAIRTQRRYDELKEKGFDISWEAVEENLKKRDEMDSTRKESPLIQTADAVVLDNSHLTPQQQLEKCIGWVEEIIEREQ